MLSLIVPKKKCYKCTKKKSLTEFDTDRSRSDGKSNKCKECRRKAERLRNSKPHSRIRHRTVSKYGITTQEYDRMLEVQGHRCVLCKRHESEFPKKLAVDHDHKTGRVRGLLCTNCNVYLGHIKDNPNVGRNIIYYLG